MRLQAPQTGYVATIRVSGIPLFIHWSFPIGGLFIALFLHDWSWQTILPAIGSYAFLITIHELGHAYAARLFGMPVHALVITAFGGLCFAGNPPTPFGKLIFYAGGLIAQAIAFAIAAFFLFSVQKPHNSLAIFLLVMTLFNAIIFIGNLIPQKNNDGYFIFQALKDWYREA